MKDDDLGSFLELKKNFKVIGIVFFMSKVYRSGFTNLEYLLITKDTITH